MDDKFDKLANDLSYFGDFVTVSHSRFEERKSCEICGEFHLRAAIELAENPANMPIGDRVWLSDGTWDLCLVLPQSCSYQPFRNLTKLLGKQLEMRPTSDHQVFESIEHLLSSLSFSLPGYFCDWEGPEISADELLSAENGHFKKLHYRRDKSSSHINLAIEFHESNHFETSQSGLTATAFGILITFWGKDKWEVPRVREIFQSALDDYSVLLGNGKRMQQAEFIFGA